MAAAADKNAEVNLTPLLDVVLQLIMFFLLTTRNLSSERFNEQIRLPVTQALVTKDKEEEERIDKAFYINLTKDNVIVNIPELPESKQTREGIKGYLLTKMEDYIRAARLEGRKARFVLILRADKEARYHKIFDVLEAGRLAGIEEYKLRAMTQPK